MRVVWPAYVPRVRARTMVALWGSKCKFSRIQREPEQRRGTQTYVCVMKELEGGIKNWRGNAVRETKETLTDGDPRCSWFPFVHSQRFCLPKLSPFVTLPSTIRALEFAVMCVYSREKFNGLEWMFKRNVYRQS